jgi:hypothetical protein
LEKTVKKAIANILSVMFILTLASCNFPRKAAPEPGTVAPMATSEPESGTAVPTAIPEPMPSGYMDLLQNKIASGEWTLEVGLVTMLKMFAGEIQVSEAGLGQGVLNTEGTGILLLAGNYLQTGTDQATRDEITRLINVLVPSQEALDLYSIPEEQATVRGGRGPGLAIPAKSDVEECANLWVHGFPVRGLPSFQCFLFDKRNIAGNSYQVYYPLAWHGDGSRDPYYTATLEAIEESIAKYQTFFGVVKPIYVVFSTLNGEFDALTYYDHFLTGEACPIIIHPSAMIGDVNLRFNQLIAHEIVHCFQSWNLTNQYLRTGADSKWWSEGMAEYFSNLVYDHVNSEHQYRERFSNFSTTVPLTNMSYENFAFFQFMGNRIGPRGVIAMLRTMPTTPGRDAQLAALAAVPGMENTFEEFVHAVMDNTLEDTDKSVIEFPEAFTDQVYFTDIENKDFSGQPFVVARFLASFPSEKSYVVETLSEGPGHSAWRPKELVGGWGPFPATAAGKCEELLYSGYVITTTPGAERKETVATTMVTADPCDKCLFGRWEATNDSVISYMQSVVDAGGDNVPTVESVTGTQFLVFGGDGIGSGGYENLKVHETGVGGVASTEVFVTFDGFASGPYTADGSILIASYQNGLSGTSEILVTVDLFANGVSVGTSIIPFRQEDLPVSSGIPTGYTCDGDTLTMFPPVEGVSVEPIVYIRTSP